MPGRTMAPIADMVTSVAALMHIKSKNNSKKKDDHAAMAANTDLGDTDHNGDSLLVDGFDMGVHLRLTDYSPRIPKRKSSLRRHTSNIKISLRRTKWLLIKNARAAIRSLMDKQSDPDGLITSSNISDLYLPSPLVPPPDGKSPISALSKRELLSLFGYVDFHYLPTLLSVCHKFRETILGDYYLLLRYPDSITDNYEFCDITIKFPRWFESQVCGFYTALHRILLYDECFFVCAYELSRAWLTSWGSLKGPWRHGIHTEIIAGIPEGMVESVILRSLVNEGRRRCRNRGENTGAIVTYLEYLEDVLDSGGFGDCDGLTLGEWGAASQFEEEEQLDYGYTDIMSDGGWSLDANNLYLDSEMRKLKARKEFGDLDAGTEKGRWKGKAPSRGGIRTEVPGSEGNREPGIRLDQLLLHSLKCAIQPSVLEEIAYLCPNSGFRLEALHPAQILALIRMKVPPWNWKKEDQLDQIRETFEDSSKALEQMERYRAQWREMKDAIRKVVDASPAGMH